MLVYVSKSSLTGNYYPPFQPKLHKSPECATKGQLDSLKRVRDSTYPKLDYCQKCVHIE